MIRTSVTPVKRIVSFDVPEEYVGKLVEVIAFTKYEGQHLTSTDKKVSFTVLKTVAKSFQFSRDEANER